MRLKRELGLLEAVVYGIGVIVGAGVFALIGQAAGLAGNALWISFLISAFVAVFTCLSYAELSAMYPKAAAEFVYVKKAYESDFWAFMIGWLLSFATVVGVSTVSLGFAGYFLELTNLAGAHGSATIIVAICLIVLLSFVNFYGIKETSRLNVLFNVMVLLGIGMVVILGMGRVPTNSINYFEMAPGGMTGVFSAAVLVFFAYLGFEDIVNISEETKTPKKIIPVALILSIIVTTIIYVLVSISVINLAGWQELAASQAPLAMAASKAMGNNAFLLVSVSALFATTSTVLILLVVASRMLYGMASDGALPRQLAKVHSRTRTPYLAVAVSMLISIAFVLVGDIGKVAKITSISSLIGFIAVNLSLMHLRFTKPKLKRPFKTPFNIGKFPVTAFIGVISCMALIAFSEMDLLMISAAVLLVGGVFFSIYKFKAPKRKYA